MSFILEDFWLLAPVISAMKSRTPSVMIHGETLKNFFVFHDVLSHLLFLGNRSRSGSPLAFGSGLYVSTLLTLRTTDDCYADGTKQRRHLLCRSSQHSHY